MTTQLTEKQIKELVIAQVEYRKAKDRLDELKEELTKDLEPGKYESKFGKVIKSVYDKTMTDWKRLIAENPEIDVYKYTRSQETVSIIIQNLNTTNSLFG